MGCARCTRLGEKGPDIELDALGDLPAAPEEVAVEVGRHAEVVRGFFGIDRLRVDALKLVVGVDFSSQKPKGEQVAHRPALVLLGQSEMYTDNQAKTAAAREQGNQHSPGDDALAPEALFGSADIS